MENFEFLLLYDMMAKFHLFQSMQCKLRYRTNSPSASMPYSYLRRQRFIIEKPRNRHQARRTYHQCTAETPRRREPMFVQDNARDRCTGQGSKRRDPKGHPHPRPDQRSVVHAQVHKHGRGQRDERPGENPIDQRQSHDAALVVNGDESECQDRGEHDTGDRHVHRTNLLREEIRRDPSEDGPGVEDREEVDVEVSGRHVFDFGVVLDVEEGDVEARQAEGHAGGEEYVGHVSKGGEFEELSFGGR